jgi:Flp pilus assembly pilin Flp
MIWNQLQSPTIWYTKSHAGTEEDGMFKIIRRLWLDESGQDIAEYAVMLAVILVLVVGTVRLIGSNANNAFSAAASAVQ